MRIFPCKSKPRSFKIFIESQMNFSQIQKSQKMCKNTDFILMRFRTQIKVEVIEFVLRNFPSGKRNGIKWTNLKWRTRALEGKVPSVSLARSLKPVYLVYENPTTTSSHPLPFSFSNQSSARLIRVRTLLLQCSTTLSSQPCLGYLAQAKVHLNHESWRTLCVPKALCQVFKQAKRKWQSIFKFSVQKSEWT